MQSPLLLSPLPPEPPTISNIDCSTNLWTLAFSRGSSRFEFDSTTGLLVVALKSSDGIEIVPIDNPEKWDLSTRHDPAAHKSYLSINSRKLGRSRLSETIGFLVAPAEDNELQVFAARVNERRQHIIENPQP